jgi:hypothetical protein
MEKEGFATCLTWLRNVTEESIKDMNVFRATLSTTNAPKKLNNNNKNNKNNNKSNSNKKNKKVLNYKEDDSYEMSGDVDSDFNSELEDEQDKEEEINFNEDTYFDSGNFMFKIHDYKKRKILNRIYSKHTRIVRRKL